MTRNALLIDLAIAVLFALVVLIVSPGVAVDAIIALIVLAVCGLSFAIGRRRGQGRIPGYRVSPDGPRRSRRPPP